MSEKELASDMLAEIMTCIRDGKIGDVFEVRGIPFTIDKDDKMARKILMAIDSTADGEKLYDLLGGFNTISFYLKFVGCIATGHRDRRKSQTIIKVEDE